jgi:hypothetical protein
MKKLTLSKTIQAIELDLLVNKFGILSSSVKTILENYAGHGVDECIYQDLEKRTWVLNNFLPFSSIYSLGCDILDLYQTKLMPFAIDPGGWHFCLCLEEHDYNAVFIHRWTDHKPEDAFLKIADSFEEFINGLQPDEAPAE